MIIFVEEIYNEGYSGIDIINLIKMEKYIKKNKYMYLIFYENIKSEYRNEKLYMFQILYFTFMRQMLSLENILSKGLSALNKIGTEISSLDMLT